MTTNTLILLWLIWISALIMKSKNMLNLMILLESINLTSLFVVLKNSVLIVNYNIILIIMFSLDSIILLLFFVISNFNATKDYLKMKLI